jgi:hypothetical protein
LAIDTCVLMEPFSVSTAKISSLMLEAPFIALVPWVS